MLGIVHVWPLGLFFSSVLFSFEILAYSLLNRFTHLRLSQACQSVNLPTVLDSYIHRCTIYSFFVHRTPGLLLEQRKRELEAGFYRHIRPELTLVLRRTQIKQSGGGSIDCR